MHQTFARQSDPIQCTSPACIPGLMQRCVLRRGPLSSGDAYLQERTAAYKASLAHSRLPSGHDYPYANIMLGKNFMVHHPFANAPPFHEVSTAWHDVITEMQGARTCYLHCQHSSDTSLILGAFQLFQYYCRIHGCCCHVLSGQNPENNLTIVYQLPLTPLGHAVAC